MLDRCQSIYFGFTGQRSKKKAGTKAGPGIELAGCPDKVEALTRRERSGSRVPKS
jgi:hypothetical protein